MNARTFVLLALVPAAFGLLQVKKLNSTFGQEAGLDDIPQKLAKVFALGSAGKASNEMIATEVEEIIEKSHGLSSEKRMQLAQVVQDMFPEDAVDLEEVVDFQPFNSLAETETAVESEGNPSKRNEYAYFTKADAKLNQHPTKDMQMEDEAKRHCIPDNLMACLVKDVNFLPCRTFNKCMGLYNNAASQKSNEYAEHLKHDRRGFVSKLNIAGKATLVAGLSACYTANLLSLPVIATTKPALYQLGITGSQADAISGFHEEIKGKTAILDKEEEKAAYADKHVPVKDRVLCAQAYRGNIKLAKLQNELADILITVNRGESRAVEHGDKKGHNLELKGHAKNTLNKIIAEMGKEQGLWATDPVMMLKHRLVGEKTNSWNEHGHAGAKLVSDKLAKADEATTPMRNMVKNFPQLVKDVTHTNEWELQRYH